MPINFFNVWNTIINNYTLKDIFKNTTELTTELNKITTNEFMIDFVFDEALANSSNLQFSLDKPLNQLKLNSAYNLLITNLINSYSNKKIIGDKEQFKTNFLIKIQELLPVYLAFYKGYSLDPFKKKTNFLNNGKSSFNGKQNNNNNFEKLENFDNYNVQTFTIKERNNQFKLNTNQINEFIDEFNYLFDGNSGFNNEI